MRKTVNVYIQISIIFTILLFGLISCSNDDSSSSLTKGRTIAIETSPPIVRDRITFTDSEGNIRLIKPKLNNKLVAVKVRIINAVSYTHLTLPTTPYV